MHVTYFTGIAKNFGMLPVGLRVGESNIPAREHDEARSQ
jgi:hypothetical protein